MVYGFHLGQGHDPLQAYITRYLHLKHPNWKISSDDAEVILTKAIPAAKKYIFAAEKRPELNTSPYKLHTLRRATGDPRDMGRPIHEFEVKQQLEKQLKIMRLFFNEDYDGPHPSFRERLKLKIMGSFIPGYYIPYLHTNRPFLEGVGGGEAMNADYEAALTNIDNLMQQRDKTFRNRGRKVDYHTKYVVKGESTHVPVYDQMMRDIQQLRASRTVLQGSKS